MHYAYDKCNSLSMVQSKFSVNTVIKLSLSLWLLPLWVFLSSLMHLCAYCGSAVHACYSGFLLWCWLCTEGMSFAGSSRCHFSIQTTALVGGWSVWAWHKAKSCWLYPIQWHNTRDSTCGVIAAGECFKSMEKVWRGGDVIRLWLSPLLGFPGCNYW